MSSVAAPCWPPLTPQQDDGGLIAHDADEWETHLARLVEDREERRRRVAQLVPWVKAEHSMETQWHRWPAAWRELLAHGRPR